MTAYTFLKTALWTATGFLIFGASAVVSLSAAAECSSLSVEFHAAAAQAAVSIKDELRLELAETIRPVPLPHANSLVATGRIDDIMPKDRPMRSDAVNAPP